MFGTLRATFFIWLILCGVLSGTVVLTSADARDFQWRFDRLEKVTYSSAPQSGLLAGYEVDPRFDSGGRRGGVILRKNGEVILGIDNDHHHYDSNGQLVSASNSSGPDFTYGFDAIGRRGEFIDNGGTGPGGNLEFTLNQPAGSFGGNGFDLTLKMQGGNGSKFYFSDTFSSNQELIPGVWPDHTFSSLTGVPELDEYKLEKNLSQFPYGGWYQWAVKGVLENEGDLAAGAYKDAVAVVDGLTWISPTFGSYEHDADGNRISAPGWEYDWDGRNRLVGAKTEGYATNPSGTKLTFEYDADGRRVQKVVITKTSDVEVTEKTHFVWDGWTLLYECLQDAQNVTLRERKYLWGADLSGAPGGGGGTGGLLAMQVTENGTTEVYYPLYDGTGNVVGLGDGAGQLVAEYRYGPFGELISATGPAAQENPWRFGTKYFDTETKLSYFGFRYYDAVTGNWLSREPLGEGESLNLYAYCHGDPINNVDVLGLNEVGISGGEATAAGKYVGIEANGDVSGAQDLLFKLQLNIELGRVDLGGTDAQIQAGVLGAVQQAMRDGNKEWRGLKNRGLISLRASPFGFSPRTDAAGRAASIMQGLAPGMAQRSNAMASAEAERNAAFMRRYHSRPDTYLNRWLDIGRVTAEGFVDIPLNVAEALLAVDATTGVDIRFNGFFAEQKFSLNEISRGERTAAVVMSLPLFGFVDDLGRSGNRIVYRALNATDRAAIDAGLGISPKGTGFKNLAAHVEGRPTGLISASETLNGARLFDDGFGMVAIDLDMIANSGVGIIWHKNLLQNLQNLQKYGTKQNLRNSERAKELLFKGSIPAGAIKLID